MNRARVQEILLAEEDFERREHLSRELADRGFYLIGRLNNRLVCSSADSVVIEPTPNPSSL